MIARMVRKTADIRFAVVAFPSRDECKHDFRTQTTQAHVVTRRDGHQQEVKCCNFNTRYLCSHVISLINKKKLDKINPMDCERCTSALYPSIGNVFFTFPEI